MASNMKRKQDLLINLGFIHALTRSRHFVLHMVTLRWGLGFRDEARNEEKSE
jgi:hypothetical protein